MTTRIKVSHPIKYASIPRPIGAVLDVDDDFATRAVAAGLATLAPTTGITPLAMDAGLTAAIKGSLLGWKDRALVGRLNDTRLGPISTDFTAVTLDVAIGSMGAYTRSYDYTLIPSVSDEGEGLRFTIGTTRVNYGPSSAMPRSLRCRCDGDKFAFYQPGGGSGSTGFMLYIDGRPTSLTPYLPVNAGSWVTVTFPTAKVRTITIRSWNGVAGLYCAKPYRIWKPNPVRGPRVLIMGDSWTSNANVTNVMNAAYWDIGPHIGSDDVWLDYMGGTGYGVTSAANGTDAPANRYLDRLGTVNVAGQTWDVATVKPDVVVIHGGGCNDLFKGRTVAQVIADASTAFRTLRTKLPDAKLVFVEGFSPPGFTPATYNPNYIAIRQGLQAALTDTGVYYIDVATTSPWFIGAGNISAPNADGENANVYITSDTFHPGDAGHLYLRARMGAQIKRVIDDDGPLVNTLLAA